MNPKTALARRYYLHVANGGKLTERDVARMVEALEEQDQIISEMLELCNLVYTSFSGGRTITFSDDDIKAFAKVATEVEEQRDYE